MSTAELVQHLSGVRSTGTGRWISLCPAHGDHSPSLSIRQASDRTLIKCWTGCKAADVVAAVGLTLADLFDNGRHHARPDVQATRRHLAGVALEKWREAEIRRCAEDLRGRDTITRQIGLAVEDGVLTQDEALISLEYEYRGYSELEYRFDHLLRNEDTLQLWRESRRAAA